MNPVLVSDRLRVRPFVMRDAPFIVELLNTPKWIQFIGDKKVTNIAQAQSYLKEGPIKSYDLHGFGLNMVELVESHRADEQRSFTPIGMCGLIKREMLEYPDLGFAILPAFEGKGYTTEAAKLMLEEGRRTYHISIVEAITTPDNIASQSVLGKLGFKKEGEIRKQDEVLVRFRIHLGQ